MTKFKRWFESLIERLTFSELIKDKNEQIDKLHNQIDLLKLNILELQCTIDKPVESGSGDIVSFDFKFMNAFSIERLNTPANGPHTVIGYIFNNGVSKEIRQWIFYISMMEHDRLLGEFNEVKKMGVHMAQ